MKLATILSLSLGPAVCAADVSFVPDTTPGVQAGGTIVFQGEVVPEDLTKVKVLMADNPKCKWISINSGGGTFITGIRLADLIKKNEYNTEAWGVGAWSAAAFMFWNGKKTDIWPEAKIGFHFPFEDSTKEPAPQAYHGIAGASIYQGAPDLTGATNLLLKMQNAYDAFDRHGYFVVFPDENGKLTSGYMNPNVSDRLYTEEEVKEIANGRQSLQKG